MTPTQGEHAQTEALRLADDLEASSLFPGNMRSCNNAAAAELRRLHAQVAALTAAPAGNEVLPLLIRDIANDLGKTPIEVMKVLKDTGHGNTSVNTAVTRPMAASLRKHFDAAPAQPAAPQGVTEVNWWEADGDKYDASISPMQPAQGVAYAELPEYLTLAVDRWFAENTGMGGCSDKDVRELAALFYGVHHSGGRESLDDALEVVESFGPEISGLNDTYARQILLADEVKRLRASNGQAPAGVVQSDRIDRGTVCANCGEVYGEHFTVGKRCPGKNGYSFAAPTAQAAPAAGAVAVPRETLVAWRQWCAQSMSHAIEHEISDLISAAPTPSAQADSALEDAARWRELREQHESDEDLCCVFAPNDMRECLVPVGSLPGELDAFMDSERQKSAARKQGAKHDNH